MKKSLVAAGVIVALGVVWTGGAWFTGKQLEGRIADMVQQANAQLRSSAPESGLELSYQDYQRGLFSSHLQLVVKPIAGQANGWLAAGQSVVLDEVVDHGPFPLASLKAFNLAPAMASVHTTLVKNDASQALFEIAKGDTPLPSIRALPTAATASRLSSLTPSTTLKAMRKSPSAAVSSSSTPTATAKHQPEGPGRQRADRCAQRI